MNAGDALGGGRYVITSRLGRGGSGAVYRASDGVLKRDVAIKVIASPTADVRERFLREAQAVARLDHPGIVKVWDVGVADGDLFIVQELLLGAPLDVVLRKFGRLPPKVALTLLGQVCDALAFAHAQGVIHRDVKPGNIFVIDPLGAKLLDFGVAKLEGQSNITQNMAVGTPHYASPEQLLGHEVDARTDVYAFGAVAFEAWSGRRLIDGGGDLYATMMQVVQGRVANLADVAPEAPPALVDLVSACVATDRDGRPASMALVGERLRELQAEFGGVATSEDWAPFATVAPTPLPAPPVSSPGTVIGPVLELGWTMPTPVPRPPLDAGAADSFRPLDTMIVDAGLPDGTRLGKYMLHQLVARGRTGHLYKAYDPVRSKLVGLKVIRRPTTAVVQRLLGASRVWIDLRHDNLQRILEVDPGDATGTALIATELIEGIDLGTLLARRQLDLTDKIEIAMQVCAALEYMHEAGIVHREVNPKNIVVSEPDLRVKVLDSGLARSSNTEHHTQTAIFAGDLRYMAPEQAGGRHDQRSDIYSVGAVIYEMVVERPYERMSSEQLAGALAQAPAVPASLAATLMQALALEPARRLESVRELADSLRALVPEKRVMPKLSSIVVTVHGIRTHARWQRAFAEVAPRVGLHCRLDRWNFGYFSVLHFLTPWSRQAKVDWFRATYYDEFGEQAMSPISTERPSVVAHSFGTYILGNALMRYPYLRFNKVLLCGSILPEDFPWDVLIDRGQVQAVRNEYGARDIWASIGQRFVPGTGASGLNGFAVTHDRLEQERFDYSHSEYFERGHMEARWVPFIKRRVHHITPRERPATPPKGVAPVGLYLLYGAVAASVLWLVTVLI